MWIAVGHAYLFIVMWSKRILDFFRYSYWTSKLNLQRSNCKNYDHSKQKLENCLDLNVSYFCLCSSTSLILYFAYSICVSDRGYSLERLDDRLHNQIKILKHKHAISIRFEMQKMHFTLTTQTKEKLESAWWKNWEKINMLIKLQTNHLFIQLLANCWKP